MSRSLRGRLYEAARVLGDVRAASRGPAALARRQARRTAYRHTNRALYRVLRAIGLGR